MTTEASRPIEKVAVACMQCGSSGGEPLWAGREHEYPDTSDEEFGFVRCSSCGLVRLDPRPDVSELARIYPPGYYAYNLVSDGSAAPGGSTDRSAAPAAFTDRLKMRMYQRRLEALVARLGKAGGIRILDVGCADGRLLDWYRASSVGDRLETHGIEMDASAADAARGRGHRVVSGRFEADRELEPGTFDLILALHVIEHVEDPRAFAARAAELLAPGGLFTIATPNWDSADARRFGGHWGGNHFPRHWTLYSELTLRDLAGSIGLSVERVEYQPNPIFWVWTCHSWLSDRFPRRSWPDRAFPPVRVFESSLQSFALQSAFTVVDLVLRALTRRTASIAVELRKRR